MENMFALFTPICLCGSALTSMWAGREAEYAKQLEQRLITPELLCKKTVDFLEFSTSQTNWFSITGKREHRFLLYFDCFRELI